MKTPQSALMLALMILAAGCVTEGVAESQLNHDSYEIRAWDGKQCDKRASDEACLRLLKPKVIDRASILCNGPAKSVTRCHRVPAPSGDRLYCVATCGKRK